MTRAVFERGARGASAARTAQASGDRGRAERLADVPRLDADPRGELEQALQRITDLVRGRTRIETRVDAALAASSITSLSGDTELWTTPSLSPAGAALHARSVAVALRTRQARARTLALIVAYGGRLAALHLHGGVAALPAVWRLVRDVLREVRQLDAAPGPATPGD